MPRPGHFTPGTETLYPFYGRLGGSQGRSGLVRKISPPTWIGFPDRPARSESLYRVSHPGQRKATSSFVITQRPSVCMKELLSDRMDCREVLYQALLLKSIDTFRLCLQTDRKKTLHTNIYLHVLRICTDDRSSLLGMNISMCSLEVLELSIQ
jgi:hypothetical protein